MDILKNLILFAVLIFLLLVTASVFVHMICFIPYVPSKKRAIDKMLDSANIQPNETIYDLGCGDGRLLTAAEKRAEIKAIGFEIAPLIYIMALARKLFSRSKMQILFKNMFSADLSRADVIFCYLFPNIMPRLKEKIQKECRKGTRIISNTFQIAGLTPAQIIEKDSSAGIPSIYVYHI